MVGRDSDKIDLRVPAGMRDRIKAAAAENGRSMNAEIVATLYEKYSGGILSREALYMELEKLSGIKDAYHRRTILRDLIERADDDALDGFGQIMDILKSTTNRPPPTR